MMKGVLMVKTMRKVWDLSTERWTLLVFHWAIYTERYFKQRTNVDSQDKIGWRKWKISSCLAELLAQSSPCDAALPCHKTLFSFALLTFLLYSPETSQSLALVLAAPAAPLTGSLKRLLGVRSAAQIWIVCVILKVCCWTHLFWFFLSLLLAVDCLVNVLSNATLAQLLPALLFAIFISLGSR